MAFIVVEGSRIKKQKSFKKYKLKVPVPVQQQFYVLREEIKSFSERANNLKTFPYQVKIKYRKQRSYPANR